MRIDPDHGTQPLAENSRSNTQNPATARTQANPLGEDQAQLSGVQTQVSGLTAQVMQLPEVRQERVQALRQAVASGSYAPSARDVAGAMLDQWALKPAA